MLLRERKNKKSKEPVSISFHEVIDPETIETAQVYGYPDPMGILNLRDDAQKLDNITKELGKDLKSLGGKKGRSRGKEKDEI